MSLGGRKKKSARTSVFFIYNSCTNMTGPTSAPSSWRCGAPLFVAKLVTVQTCCLSCCWALRCGVRVWKPGRGDDAAAGGRSGPSFLVAREEGAPWGRTRGGRDALWRGALEKGPGWPFPLRRVDAKAQATGRSEQTRIEGSGGRLTWGWEQH